MKCKYSDGMKVDYSGFLHIRKGDEINVYMKQDFIPANIRNDLERASRDNRYDDFRKIAFAVTDIVGSKVCIHE
jgi:hypothetical protein